MATQQTMSSKDVINMVRGWPAPSLLPADAISKAAQAVLADPAVAVPGLQYGPDEGYGPLRETIGSWLTSFYQPNEAIGKERISITGGASQNLGCVLQVFTDPVYTKDILFAAPAFMLAFRIFEDHGFAGKMKAVPEDEAGLDVRALRRALEESERQDSKNDAPILKPKRSYAKLYRHVIYCVPTFSNPSSRTMPLERRMELVRCARDFDALIVADDVYDFLQWPADLDSPPSGLKKADLPRLVDIDRELDGGVERKGADGFGNAMSNGSFSKICGPGVRVGWAEGSPKFAYGVSQVGTTCSGGAPSQLSSTYMNKLLVDGTLQAHIFDVLQPAYSARYKTLTSAAKQHLSPLGVTMPQPNRDIVGGYFIWLTLPATVKALDFSERCQDEGGVIVAPGKIFEVPGDSSVKFEHSIRLTFSWVDEDRMVEAVKRIKLVLESCLRGEAPTAGPKQENGKETPF